MYIFKEIFRRYVPILLPHTRLTCKTGWSFPWQWSVSGTLNCVTSESLSGSLPLIKPSINGRGYYLVCISLRIHHTDVYVKSSLYNLMRFLVYDMRDISRNFTLLWNSNFHYCVHMFPPLVRMLNPMNTVHTFPN